MAKREVTIDLDEEDRPSGGPPVDEPADDDRPGDPGAGRIVDEDQGDDGKLPDHAVLNSDGTVTLPLFYPVEQSVRKAGKVRIDRYEKLTLHRLTGGDQRTIASTSDEQAGMVALACSTRIGRAVMSAVYDKMDLADINAAARVLNSFLAIGQRTGRSS